MRSPLPRVFNCEDTPLTVVQNIAVEGPGCRVQGLSLRYRHSAPVVPQSLGGWFRECLASTVTVLRFVLQVCKLGDVGKAFAQACRTWPRV